MKNHRSGFTRQSVRDLNHLKGPSLGRVLEIPPFMDTSCKHPSSAVRIDKDGDAFCSNCRAPLF
jgi:hypothetical protein